MQNKIISVNYHFTRKCNFNCGFCFHTQKNTYKLPIEEARRGLQILKEYGVKKINFAGGEPFTESRFLGELVKICKLELKIEDFAIEPETLGEMINLISNKELSLDHAKKLLYEAISKGVSPLDLIKEKNLHQINDKDELLKLITSLMDKNEEQVRQYVEEDNMSIINFFIGQTMKESNRQANPNMSKEIIKEELERRKNK